MNELPLKNTKIEYQELTLREKEKIKKEVEMIYELSKVIVKEVNDKLDSIYNYRKEREGLISLQNTLINELRKEVKRFVDVKKILC